MKLSDEFTFYVPSTRADQTVDLSLLEQRTAEILTIFVKHFGAATLIAGFGCWTSETGQIIREPVNLVQSSSDDPSNLQFTLDLASEMLTAYSQEAIAVKHNQTLHIVE